MRQLRILVLGNSMVPRPHIEYPFNEITVGSTLSRKSALTMASLALGLRCGSVCCENAIINRTKEICTFQLEKKADRIISELQWMGILSSEMAIVKNGKTLDTLCAQLEKALTFNPGERDLVMLQRNFFVERANGEKKIYTSTLELPGDPKGHSALFFSVRITCGIVLQLLLDRHPKEDIKVVEKRVQVQ